MKNVPTDLLRTFLCVVDLRSFTRAGAVQGLTQPAVSAQIKRLQAVFGAELLDKSHSGVRLTATGEYVVNAARQMLSISDRILTLSRRNPAVRTIRVGIPGDCMGAELGRMLARTRQQWPELHFAVKGGGYLRLTQALRDNDLDVVFALAVDEPVTEARAYWTESLAWVRAEKTVLDPHAPVPVVGYRERCACLRVGIETLRKAGRDSDLVFRATSAEGLRSAVAEGVGVMVVPRRRVPAGLRAWDDGPLPPLPDIFGGVFLREDCEDEVVIAFADHVAATMQPRRVAADA